ncbi:MAG TPA: AAA family ATPase [Povalibacter sp.]|nr:AAA family ATPase [Povalibacter sp.]
MSDIESSSATQPAVASSVVPFGLAQAPFGDCIDDSFFFPSEQHLRALEFMGHVTWGRSRLGVITAAHGCGKSLLIGRFLRELDDHIVAAAVSRENLGPREFLLEVLRQYGFALDDSDRTDRRRMLERFLTHQGTMGRMCVLVVENAQQMHPSVLEELRYFAALEVEGARVLKVLLLGQPTLNLVLDSPRMSELLTRGVVRMSLDALSERQTAAYVAHRLRAAGAQNPDELMPYTLMPAIFTATGGVPLRINQLCERALICAVADGENRVTAEALERARSELAWPAVPVRIAAAATPELQSEAPAPARLIVTMQGLPDRETVLDRDRSLIGRGEEADVRIDSVFVSRYHALVVRYDGQDLLIDLGSTNGLLINSRRIVRRVLRDQDVIQIGPAKVTYRNAQVAPAQHPDPAETICFARPGFPMAAGEEEGSGTVIAFGQLDPTRPGNR